MPLRRLLLCIFWLGFAPGIGRAATPLSEVVSSPDVTVDLSSTVVVDEDLAEDDLMGGVSALLFTGLASRADVIAQDAQMFGPDVLLALDTAVGLPSTPTSITARPGDVLLFDGSDYFVSFDADAAGIPRGVRVDAVADTGTSLMLSFDTTVDLGGGLVAHDEDLVLWTASGFIPFLDGSAAGVAPGLDLDAVDFLGNTHLLISFDGSGSIGGAAFDDEDLLEYDRDAGTWELVYDGSAEHAGWTGGPDLDAAEAVLLPEPGFAICFALGIVTLRVVGRRRIRGAA